MDEVEDEETLHARGRRLRMVRRSLGISQQEMADELGVTQASVSHIENGRQGLTLTRISMLASKFGVCVHWFVTGEGSQFLESETEATHTPYGPTRAHAGYIQPRKESLMEALTTHVLPELSESNEMRIFKVPAGVLEPPISEGDWIIARRARQLKELSGTGMAIVMIGDDLHFRKLQNIDADSMPRGIFGAEFTRARSQPAELWIMVARITRQYQYSETLEERIDALESAISKLTTIIPSET